MTRGAVHTLTDTATFVVFHPVRSALRVLGVAKGVVEIVTGHAPDVAPPPVSVLPPQRTPDRVDPSLTKQVKGEMDRGLGDAQ